MKYSPANYKKDIKRFNELALLLKAKKKDKNAPKNKPIFQKAEEKYNELEEKLKKDYPEKHKRELFKMEQDKIREESVAAAKEYARKYPIYDRDGNLVDGEIVIKPVDKETLEKIAAIEKSEEDDDILRAERLFNEDLKEVKEETTITTKADGTKTIEVKKKF